MLVKLEKLTFYPFKLNSDLFYYYAVTDGLTFRGVATPELAEALYDHLEAGEPFNCKILEREDKSFKLVELLEAAKISSRSNDRRTGLIDPDVKKETFTPNQLTVYKHSWGSMMGYIKAESKFFGMITKTWFRWYLTMMRKETEIQMMVRRKTKTFFTDEFQIVTGDDFLDRREATYLDNKERFFFANESPSLELPTYLNN